jgi:hypothetical protein
MRTHKHDDAQRLTNGAQVNRYLGMNVSKWKHYFNVSNSYVVNKLLIVLFPWRHRPWTRRQAVGPNGQDSMYLPPREDINSPDMYIPGKWLAIPLKEQEAS